MHAWSIRVDGSYQDLSGFFVKFIDKSEEVVIYEHPPTPKGHPVHCHAQFWEAKFSKQTFYDNVKKVQHIASETDKKKQATMYYCKELKSRSIYIRYMTKGKYDPVFVKNIEQHVIDYEKSLGFDKYDLKKENGDNSLVEDNDTMNKPKKYTIVQLQSECVDEFSHMSNAGKKHLTDVLKKELIIMIRNTAVNKYDEGKLTSRVSYKTVVEIGQACMLYWYPDYCSDLLYQRL